MFWLNKNRTLAIGIAFMAFLSTGCLTFYQRNINLMEAYEQRNYEKANSELEHKKWQKQKRNLLLYYLNKGTVLHMLGNYEESNNYFQKADYFIEDYRKSYGLKALSFISNPSVETYAGENYEKLLVHYYTTLNYLHLNDFDAALIECKRMLLLNENIATYYKKEKKLHQDAFTHALLGIVYEAKKDYGNAFIAYRNAYEVYRDVYVPLLGSEIPLQIKKDVLRTAYINGYYSDVAIYEKEFGFPFDKNELTNNVLVTFWNNGLCPIKERRNITFVISDMGNGYVLFYNAELGLSFPFYMGDNKDQKGALLGMKLFRVSFPNLESRPTKYSKAYVIRDSVKQPIEVVEDIDLIAHKVFKDKMLKEYGQVLLRMALKKLAEIKAQQTNDGLGAIVNIANAITEQADTRNWQTLPSAIAYSRTYLKERGNNIVLQVDGATTSNDTLLINVEGGRKTHFHSFSTY